MKGLSPRRRPWWSRLLTRTSFVMSTLFVLISDARLRRSSPLGVRCSTPRLSWITACSGRYSTTLGCHGRRPAATCEWPTARSRSVRVHNLPAAVGTLEVLAQIPVDVLNQYIDNGEISASTTRKDALRLVNHATDPYARVSSDGAGTSLRSTAGSATSASTRASCQSGDRAVLPGAAQVWWRSGEWLPTPPFWPSDGAEYIARVAGELRGFLDWMANVGIEPASFLERFLDDDVTKAELFSTLDAEALAEWWLDGSDNDRRFAALGHWFSWCSSIARSS